MLKFFASVIIMFSLPFYTITEMLFRVFFVLAEGELVSPDKYELLISNFYVILGVVLLFVLSFSLLKMMVNPEEKKGTESTKKIIMNLITSAVIMVLLPTIFTFAFDLQTSVIGSEYNVIGKLFGFGASNTEVVDGEKSNVKQAAATITNSIFTAFFNVDVNYCENEINSDTDLETCQKSIMDNNNEKTFFEVIDDVNQSGELIKYKNFSEAWTDQKIEYNVLLSIICGAILIYVVASFCIDMAIRLVKLVFYQLIAPIPLFFRVVPDTKLSNSFNQWVKATLATYFEVYIRIIIVYFVLYLCLQIEGLDILGFIGGEIGVFGRLVAKALIFIGLITFMRQAPKLISEVTGIDSGNIKLGIKEKLKDGGFFAAANAAGSLVTSKGNPLAALRGAKHGWSNADLKNIGREDTRRKAWEDAMGKGARRRDLLLDDLRSSLGFETAAEAAERRVRQGKLPNGQKISVTNTSGSDIIYGDGENEIIRAGNQLEMTEDVVEKMKSTMKANEGKMAPTETRIKELEKKSSFAKSQRGLKDSYDGEADKKWKEGKFSTQVTYLDELGKIHTEKVTEARFDELNSRGVKYLDANKPFEYKVGNETFTESTLTENFITGINEGQIDLLNASFLSDNKEIREKMRKEFIDTELGKGEFNLMASKTEEFLQNLRQDAFSYESVVMENGKPKRDSNGEFVRVNGKLSYDGSNITNSFTDSNGNVTTEIYENLGYGKWKKIVNGVEEVISSFDLSDLFDKKAKETLNAVGDDIQIQKQKIQAYKETNENIQELLNQYDKGIAEALESPYHRAIRATSDYHNKNKK